ncbi:damage-inducible protein CinA [Chromatiales bacterium (ex Bugula neritina AB1)]|nr:damage-inducible protein CinA [Chromatiales bacterium (ex Bugula neritina AB1)]
MNSAHTTLVQKLAGQAIAADVVIATAESCTGGLISAALTDIAGSSAFFDRAFITYSNDAKMELLGVTDETLSEQGAVSGATVAQMAQGALVRSNATLAVAVSGVAGPDGGTDSKPVGTVWIAWASDRNAYTRHFLFAGDRASVREQTVTEALRGLIRCIETEAI